MRLSTVVALSSVVLLAVVVGGYLMARKYAVSVELTRNAAANAKARQTEANELLQRLAGSPKLTIGSQTENGAKRGQKPLVLAVVSRHVLPLIASAAGTERSSRYPLLERLENVDVESVSYKSAAIPALIEELTSVQSEHQTSPLNGDLTKLIEGLKQGSKQGSQVIFY